MKTFRLDVAAFDLWQIRPLALGCLNGEHVSGRPDLVAGGAVDAAAGHPSGAPAALSGGDERSAVRNEVVFTEDLDVAAWKRTDGSVFTKHICASVMTQVPTPGSSNKSVSMQK